MNTTRPPSDRPAGVASRREDDEIRAAIDLGTNSFHLLIARVDADGHFDVLGRDKEVVRLGSGAGTLREITPDAIERGLAALRRFRSIADSYGATIDAIGTSALREADNREDFVARARQEVGIEVDVVSGSEEARLIHLGVLQSVPLFAERILVVDIGGGSTELVIGEGTEMLVGRSMKVGAIRLTDRFFPGGIVRRKAVAECRRYIRSFLAPVVSELRQYGPFRAVGSSGTILNLARMIAAAEGADPASVVSGDSFGVSSLEAIASAVVSCRTPRERERIAGLDAHRQDIIPAGALLLEEILHLFSIDRMVVADGALREGILVDRAAARSTSEVAHRLSNIRRRSVEYLAASFHEDLTHIEWSTRLALDLFDTLAGVHGLGDAERNLLEAGSLLHNVGLFISHAGHQRHSYYVIRHTDQLTGFTDREVELIALIARYHRKGRPRRQHAAFGALGPADQALVRVLAGILRIAIALDRSRTSAVESVALVKNGRRRITLVARHDPAADIGLERYAVAQQTDLLGRSLGRDLVVRFAPTAGS